VTFNNLKGRGINFIDIPHSPVHEDSRRRVKSKGYTSGHLYFSGLPGLAVAENTILTLLNT
jgi:hypothetical protein